MAQCVVPPVVYQLTGPLVLGYQFNWALYGVLTVQVYIFNQAALPDNRITKYLVYSLYIIETLQTILATHDSFHELALSWGNFSLLTSAYLTWLSLPVLTGLTSATIQCFYAWRIYLLSRSKTLTILIMMLALTQGSAAIAEGIQIVISQNVPGTQVDTFQTTAVWLGGTAFCDVMIACTMVYFLSRSRTGFKVTDTILNKIMKMVVETGMATAVLAIIELTLFLTFKHNFYHTVPALMLSKLYSNSLLVLLNNRISFQEQKNTSMDSSHTPSRKFYRRDAVERGTAIQVSINQETSDDGVEMFKLPRGNDDLNEITSRSQASA